jgi:hypothetical protein
MDKRERIVQYYRCYRERDLETLRAMLTPNFRHTSSFAQYTDRDKMLAEIWPMVGQSWAKDIQVIGAGSEYIARFVVESKDKTRPPLHMAEYIRFEGDKIAEIETYMGRSE